MPDIFITPEDAPADPPALTTQTPPPTVPKTEEKRNMYPEHTHSKLASFCLYPEDIDFETRENEEKIILMLRAHIVTNVKWIFITLVLLLIPGILKTFGVFSMLPTGFELVITLGWYLVTSAYALESFLSWYFNVYFVTNLRVIDVDFYNLIYKQVSDANIDKIQDVSYNMGGVGRTFFNFGNVFIQTAAEVNNFDFLAVPNPDKVAKIIEDMITKADK